MKLYITSQELPKPQQSFSLNFLQLMGFGHKYTYIERREETT